VLHLTRGTRFALRENDFCVKGRFFRPRPYNQRMRLRSRTAISVRSVLLVDDDPLFLRAHRRSIEGLGKSVSLATGAAEALSLAQSERHDLAIVDMLLGPAQVASGIELVEALRRDRDELYIILWSCAANARDWTLAYEAGVDLAVEKSQFEMCVLFAHIETGTPLPRRSRDAFPRPSEVKRDYLRYVVTTCGSIHSAAKALGLHRSSLQQQLKKRGECE